MDAGEKICPSCAETIKAAATICRHCQHNFVPRRRSRLGRSVAIVIAFFSVVLLVYLFAGQDGNDSQDNDPGSETPSIAVNSTELAQAYADNEVAAQNRFGDKTLNLTGLVTGVTLDFSSAPVIQFAGVNPFLPVQARFDKSFGDALGRISKGQTITIRCTSVTEVISAPILSDCSLPD
jgi:hypothetical protein